MSAGETRTALVLAVEPDQQQANVLARVIRQRVKADLVVVDSRDAAIAALSARVPDVILLTALLSPRDEDEMVAHLRTLPGADHVQTHTIPQLASGEPGASAPAAVGGLLAKFRRKKESKPIQGCDPALFADEVSTFLARAAEMKAHSGPALVTRAPHAGPATFLEGVALETALEESDVASSWASPFEWRRPDAEPETAGAAAQEPGERQTEVPPAAPDPGSVRDAGVRKADKAQRKREAAAEAAAERARIEAEADAERMRLRVKAEAEAERTRLRVEAEAEAERTKLRLEAEAAAERTRLRLEAEQHRARMEAEARVEADRAHKQLEAEAHAERERVRLETKAQAERERRRVEAEAAALLERKRFEEMAAAERERARLADEERERLTAEAAALKAQLAREAAAAAERERLRIEAQAAADRERARLEAAAMAEREQAQARLAAEVAAREQRRLEAEAATREEQLRRDAAAERSRMEAQAAAERSRLEAEAAAERAQLEAAARADVLRLEAEAAAERERSRRDAEDAAGARAAAAAREQDPFADFRSPADAPAPLLDLMPIARWAKVPQPRPSLRRQAGPSPEPAGMGTCADDLQELMAGLALPAQVAGVTYARGCRIRRVRVPASVEPAMPASAPVIVSRRALEEMRTAR